MNIPYPYYVAYMNIANFIIDQLGVSDIFTDRDNIMKSFWEILC